MGEILVNVGVVVHFPIVMQTCIFKFNFFFGLTQLFFVTNRFLPKNLPRCLLYVNNI